MIPFWWLWVNQTDKAGELKIRRSYREELLKADCPYRVAKGVPLGGGQTYVPVDGDELAFLLDCLEVDPGKRLSMKRLLEKYRRWLGLAASVVLN